MKSKQIALTARWWERKGEAIWTGCPGWPGPVAECDPGEDLVRDKTR